VPFRSAGDISAAETFSVLGRGRFAARCAGRCWRETALPVAHHAAGGLRVTALRAGSHRSPLPRLRLFLFFTVLALQSRAGIACSLYEHGVWWFFPAPARGLTLHGTLRADWQPPADILAGWCGNMDGRMETMASRSSGGTVPWRPVARRRHAARHCFLLRCAVHCAALRATRLHPLTTPLCTGTHAPTGCGVPPVIAHFRHGSFV